MTDTTVTSKHDLLEYLSLGINEICGEKGFSYPAEARIEDNPLSESYARGMSVRFGRSAFLYWLRENQESLGWEDLEFRLLPTRKKISVGLVEIKTWFIWETGFDISIKESVNEWQLLALLPIQSQINTTPNLWEFLQGFLQEFTRWAGQGRLYKVDLTNEENRKIITISKLPFD